MLIIIIGIALLLSVVLIMSARTDLTSDQNALDREQDAKHAPAGLTTRDSPRTPPGFAHNGGHAGRD